MKVVLAHDYLTQRGGAERLALTLAKLFPRAPMYTSVFNTSSTFGEFKDVKVKTTFMQRSATVRADPRLGLPMMPMAWASFELENDVELAICSSTGWAHGLRVPGGCRKVVYCHNPARWLYQTSEYIQSKGARALFAPLKRTLVAWDKRAARTADLYLANSRQVADRIWHVYGLEAEVVHPPVMIDGKGPQSAVGTLESGFWLVVARSRTYKNVGPVVEAFEHLPGERLVIVGGGHLPQTTSNVHSVGVVEDSHLRWLYANAKGLIAVSFEDFGLTPIEANVFGTPVAVLRAGGFLESTNEGVSGAFIEAATAHEIARTVKSFPSFRSDLVQAHAAKFGLDEFGRRLYRIAQCEQR
jgi:glycosyltransferase involved in cell wall biosynthesis